MFKYFDFVPITAGIIIFLSIYSVCCISIMCVWVLPLKYSYHRILSEGDGREACNLLHAVGPSKVCSKTCVLEIFPPVGGWGLKLLSIMNKVCLCFVSHNYLANVYASSGCNYKYKCRWESSPHWQLSKGKGGINVTYNVVTNGNILFLILDIWILV